VEGLEAGIGKSLKEGGKVFDCFIKETNRKL